VGPGKLALREAAKTGDEICLHARKRQLSQRDLHWARGRFTKRIAAHNSGQASHTAKFKPWRLVTYIGFTDESKAIAFERYLKTASGRAFANSRDAGQRLTQKEMGRG